MTIIDFLEYVKAAGAPAAMVFAILYWLERDEKKDAQKELLEVTKKSIEAIVEMKSLISQLMILFSINDKPKQKQQD